MHVRESRLRSSPTDLANFLSCRHKTTLDAWAAAGRIEVPVWNDPLAVALRDRGQAHEAAYIARLRADGLVLVDLTPPDVPERPKAEELVTETLNAMRSGADVIVQAALATNSAKDTSRGPAPVWFGYADVLRRVAGESALGGWHYEVHDTKLTRETRGGTILQLSVYTELVAAVQERRPEYFNVITPARDERYRVDDFSAFFRSIAREYAAFLAARARDGDEGAVYPDPVEHCEICRWWERCNRRRRSDDHLRFVAGLGRRHQSELTSQSVPTLAALAVAPMPISFKPKRGSQESYGRLREQARMQARQRAIKQPVHELLNANDADFGLRLLPVPSPGDVFLDFEGDPFGRPGAAAEAGQTNREYLVGLGRMRNGVFHYDSRWAFSDTEERDLFEWLIDELASTVTADPGAHIYHYAPYETSAIRRLVARYATRELAVDELLRGSRFVDLYAVVRRSLRVGAEGYSIKDLEPCYGFCRDVELERAGDQRRVVELALETGDQATVTADVRGAVEGYNRDDCRSTKDLRDWLETLRAQAEADGGVMPRPGAVDGTASEEVKARDARAAALRARLQDRVRSGGPTSVGDRALWCLSYLIDWHRREERIAWGEYHRLREKSAEDLEDEAGALVGLTFVDRVAVPAPKSRAKRVTDRYRYPPQECELRKGDELRLPDDSPFGSVVALDRGASTIDIIKAVAATDVHPSVAIGRHIVSAGAMETAVMTIGERIAGVGLDDESGDRLVNDLLLARGPRLRLGTFEPRDGESASDFAVRIVGDLDESILAIQGPPGAGKTYTGARMIGALVRAGRRVGVVATGHSVIRKLVADSVKEASEDGFVVPAAHKVGDGDRFDDLNDDVLNVDENEGARVWLEGQKAGAVLGGTAWLWSRPEFSRAVDVLFVDEAGQMSLANVLAVSQGARSLVMLGDPRQLEQPQQGSHPDGVGVSALEHMLGGHQTMPEGRGIFLPETWRMAPAITTFTSELFYEGKLSSRSGRERQRIDGSARFDGTGLRLIAVAHDDCRNASDPEVEEVSRIVDELLAPGVEWTDHTGLRHQITADDVLVVAPFNAQVSRLRDRLADRSIAAGTVDKFQGQEAAVVIYSMAVSRPEDAPRGMSFLYNPNRLNVATSRARCLCILVASPRLFEPECKTPQEMRLANALCRYRELARDGESQSF